MKLEAVRAVNRTFHMQHFPWTLINARPKLEGLFPQGLTAVPRCGV